MPVPIVAGIGKALLGGSSASGAGKIASGLGALSKSIGGKGVVSGVTSSVAAAKKAGSVFSPPAYRSTNKGASFGGLYPYKDYALKLGFDTKPLEAVYGSTKAFEMIRDAIRGGDGLAALFSKNVSSTMNKSNLTNSNFFASTMPSISGGVSFGDAQKKYSVIFWVIGAAVILLVLRPFGIGFDVGRKKRR